MFLPHRVGDAGLGPAVRLVVQSHVTRRILRHVGDIHPDQEVLADVLYADQLEQDVIAFVGPQGVRVPLDRRFRGWNVLFFLFPCRSEGVQIRARKPSSFSFFREAGRWGFDQRLPINGFPINGFPFTGRLSASRFPSSALSSRTVRTRNAIFTRTLSPSLMKEMRRTDMIRASVTAWWADSPETVKFVTSVVDVECCVLASFLTSASLSMIASADVSAGVWEPRAVASAVLKIMDSRTRLMSWRACWAFRKD